MILTDTHTHLYAKEFDEDREAMLQAAQEAGVQRFFLPNIDSGSVQPLFELVQKHPQSCFPMMGLHPCSVKENVEEELETVRRWLFAKKSELPFPTFYAVGEIGLDYYWDTTFKQEQINAFRRQIDWAKELGLPVAIHCRESMSDILSILKEMKDERLRGVLHCFTGTVEDANVLIELGFYLGIGGVVTFKNGGLDKTMQDIDLKHIILETDAPYLAPAPHRGKRNESAYIRLVADKLAEIKGVSVEEVAEVSTENSRLLFGI